MKTDRLFNILVLGGALITAPSIQGSEVSPRNSHEIPKALLESDPIPPTLAVCSPDDEKVCVIDDEGNSVPRAGLACCWGTSCEG